MNEKLMDTMSEYKQITFNIMYCIENEKFDDIDELFKRRQSIINSLSSIDYTKEESDEVVLKLELKKLECDAENIAHKKKFDISSKIKSFLNNKHANIAYNSGRAGNSMYFNKKI
ncbi:flagellar protein FliT [Clostridium tyrobutyricum]|uniref:flagellar protein FliT n=1 Tax=Clostridium tyrobutyricum TaxID=1519 RepID=UPI00189DE948|nr:flagellar protein FliT [Clostridium tyrobutyricum]